MGTKTVDQLTVITSLNSTDKIGVWKDSSDEYCGIAYSDLLTNVGVSAYLKLDGSTTMTGALAMGTHAISGVTSITMSSTITGVTGITMSGTLNLNTNAISNVTTLNGVSLSTGYILAAGTVVLTADWDIGSGRTIKGDQIAARSASGLKLWDATSGKGMFVQDTTGWVGFGHAAPGIDIHISRSNANDVGIQVTNSSNSALMRYYAEGATGNSITGWPNSGVIEAVPASTGGLVFSAYSGSILFQVNARTTAMTVKSDGTVGIGVSPSYLLHTYNATSSDHYIQTDAGGQASILMGTGAGGLWQFLRPASSTDLQISYQGVTNVIVAKSTGKVAIGANTGPDSRLHVYDGSAGSVTASTDTILTVESSGNSGMSMLCPDANESHLIWGRASSNNVASIKLTASGTNQLQIMRSNVAKITIDSTGNFFPSSDNAITCGASGQRWSAVWAANATIQTSDLRLKSKTKASKLGLSFIMALKPLQWVWKDSEHGRIHYGLAAQEVKQVMDDQKTGDFGGYVYDSETDIHSLRYAEFTAPLIGAIQEQQSLIDKLTQTVSELLSKVQALQGV